MGSTEELNTARATCFAMSGYEPRYPRATPSPPSRDTVTPLPAHHREHSGCPRRNAQRRLPEFPAQTRARMGHSMHHISYSEGARFFNVREERKSMGKARRVYK